MNGDASTSPGTIVLIHGLWMTPLSWEHWVERFRARGFEVLAPAWPGLDGEVQQIRDDPSTMESLGIEEIIEHYAVIVRELDSPPIIMGHSFGGAFTEVLLDRGLGAAGVAIDAAAVRGVARLSYSTLRSTFPVLKNPVNERRAVGLTFAEFRYAFANTMSRAEARAAFDRYAVPGPGRVLFQGAFANFNLHAATKVDFHNDKRAPLLLIAGGADHVVPPSVDRATARRFSHSQAITEYREFPGRCHFTVGQEGWEQVADCALDWALEHARMPAMA